MLALAAYTPAYDFIPQGPGNNIVIIRKVRSVVTWDFFGHFYGSKMSKVSKLTDIQVRYNRMNVRIPDAFSVFIIIFLSIGMKGDIL